MHYRELAAKQRGFLLRSQLTEEEIQEARETGFIIENPPSRLDYLFYTKKLIQAFLNRALITR